MLRSCLHRLRAALAATEGNVAILFSLSAPLMIAGISFGVETGYWFYRQASLQSAADAAAYAAAIEARAGSTSSDVVDAATAAAVANGYSTGTGTITVISPFSTSGGTTSVKVLLTRTDSVRVSRTLTLVVPPLVEKGLMTVIVPVPVE